MIVFVNTLAKIPGQGQQIDMKNEEWANLTQIEKQEFAQKYNILKYDYELNIT